MQVILLHPTPVRIAHYLHTPDLQNTKFATVEQASKAINTFNDYFPSILALSVNITFSDKPPSRYELFRRRHEYPLSAKPAVKFLKCPDNPNFPMVTYTRPPHPFLLLCRSVNAVLLFFLTRPTFFEDIVKRQSH